ncbi:MAG: class I SAM-dependent methyltransferase, partial [Aquificaceae bacterium]|nr:class I SAM-dependent methyltransferase [Aquificaceae bacterium]
MQVFDLYAEKYDRWYNEPLGRSIFEAEVDCLKSLEPPSGRLLEVGVGSGRFAKALGISYGVDISRKLLRIA